MKEHNKYHQEKLALTEPGAMFAALDARLEDDGNTLDLVVCGGIVLQTVYRSIRDTHDIDSLTLLDDFVREAVTQVGESFLGSQAGNSESWLNDDAVRFFILNEILPTGWRDRAMQEHPIFVGRSLRVFPISRRDLMLLKLMSFFNHRRQEKEKDLKDLKLLFLSTEEVMDMLDDLYEMLLTIPIKKTRFEIKEMLAEMWT